MIIIVKSAGNDANLVYEGKRTYDPPNSLIGRFSYARMDPGVRISELQLTISYYLPEIRLLII
jgi:hypothetical protein